MKKNLLIFIIVLSVVLGMLCTYNIGYYAAIKDARVTSYVGPGYEITFGNQTHYYE